MMNFLRGRSIRVPRLLIVLALFLSHSVFPQALRVRATRLGKTADPPYAELTNCVADHLAPQTYRILVDSFPASPARGGTGSGSSDSTTSFEAWGVLKLDEEGNRVESEGSDYFRMNELVAVKGSTGAFSLADVTEVVGREYQHLNVNLKSVLKHNVSHGNGAYPRESTETLNSTLRVPLSMRCEKFKAIWNTLFTSAEP